MISTYNSNVLRWAQCRRQSLEYIRRRRERVFVRSCHSERNWVPRG